MLQIKFNKERDTGSTMNTVNGDSVIYVEFSEICTPLSWENTCEYVGFFECMHLCVCILTTTKGNLQWT